MNEELKAELMGALNTAANAGTDSLIDESDIKEWLLDEALSLMSEDQLRTLAKQFAEGLENGYDSLAMVHGEQKQEALDALRPYIGS